MKSRAAFSLLAVTLLPWAAAAVADPGGSAKAYAECPGSEGLASAADVQWTPAKSALTDHQSFRRSLGLKVPKGQPRILWYGNGGDLATTTISVVAVRKLDGIWHVDGVGQSQIWIKGAKPDRLPTIDRDLDVAASRKLDLLIVDPCLVSGPTFQRNPNIAAGGLINTLEVETSAGHWVGGWWGAPTAQEEAITKLIGTN